MKLLLLAVSCFILITSAKKFLVGTNSLDSRDDNLDIDMIMKNMEMQKKDEHGKDYQDDVIERKRGKQTCLGE